ncbi:hypothetical protein L1887_57187 [Cichorium endivia]|nr:hypothetical protein L1887_57187 [Cichorium endivia]
MQPSSLGPAMRAFSQPGGNASELARRDEHGSWLEAWRSARSDFWLGIKSAKGRQSDEAMHATWASRWRMYAAHFASSSRDLGHEEPIGASRTLACTSRPASNSRFGSPIQLLTSGSSPKSKRGAIPLRFATRAREKEKEKRKKGRDERLFQLSKPLLGPFGITRQEMGPCPLVKFPHALLVVWRFATPLHRELTCPACGGSLFFNTDRAL